MKYAVLIIDLSKHFGVVKGYRELCETELYFNEIKNSLMQEYDVFLLEELSNFAFYKYTYGIFVMQESFLKLIPYLDTTLFNPMKMAYKVMNEQQLKELLNNY